MIEEFVMVWDHFKEEVEAKIRQKHPENYDDLVKWVIEMLHDHGCQIDPKRIVTIDDGDYQGTLLFVIAKNSSQPSTYYYVYVDYGSCSSCDTLQGIYNDGEFNDGLPNEQQVKDYMTLALHIVQGLKRME